MPEPCTRSEPDVRMTLLLITTAVVAGTVARVLSLLVSASTCAGS